MILKFHYLISSLFVTVFINRFYQNNYATSPDQQPDEFKQVFKNHEVSGPLTFHLQSKKKSRFQTGTLLSYEPIQQNYTFSPTSVFECPLFHFQWNLLPEDTLLPQNVPQKVDNTI